MHVVCSSHSDSDRFLWLVHSTVGWPGLMPKGSLYIWRDSVGMTSCWAWEQAGCLCSMLGSPVPLLVNMMVKYQCTLNRLLVSKHEQEGRRCVFVSNSECNRNFVSKKAPQVVFNNKNPGPEGTGVQFESEHRPSEREQTQAGSENTAVKQQRDAPLTMEQQTETSAWTMQQCTPSPAFLSCTAHSNRFSQSRRRGRLDPITYTDSRSQGPQQWDAWPGQNFVLALSLNLKKNKIRKELICWFTTVSTSELNSQLWWTGQLFSEVDKPGASFCLWLSVDVAHPESEIKIHPWVWIFSPVLSCKGPWTPSVFVISRWSEGARSKNPPRSLKCFSASSNT